MKRNRKNRVIEIAAAVATVVALGIPVSAGEAPKAAPAKKDAPKTPPKPETAGEWQARLAAKVLEWTDQTDLDYGFSIGYFRDPSHPNSIVGPLEDGRAVVENPDAFLTLPSQSQLDLGLRIFLDQMNARNGSLEAVIEALEQQGKVRMLAEPFLTLKKGGGESVAEATQRIPYGSQQPVTTVGFAEVTLFQDTGVVLKVTLTDVLGQKEGLTDNYAKLKVLASFTSLAGYVTVAVDKNGKPTSRAPQTNMRSISNTVLVRDNTTLIAGVIKEDSDVMHQQGPPVLGRIPYIRELFRNRSQRVNTREILFLMHVSLIAPGAV